MTGLCESGEVVVGNDGKLVLVGSSVVIYPKVPEVMLAEFVSQLRYLSGTIIHNAKLPSNKKGIGRFQQVVYGRLSDRAFTKYCLGVRPVFRIPVAQHRNLS
jgi:ABC-type Fe3+/spermidine/putrescine transport system ATPase subunit